MATKWIVELTEEERERLVQLTSSGKPGARRMKRAQILLMADDGFPDAPIMAALNAGSSTVYRTRKKLVEGGVDHALNDAPRPGGSRKLTCRQEVVLMALACSDPPEGRSRWTLKLLADRLVALTDLEGVSAETIRRRLHEKELKPWQRRMWNIGKVDAEFIARMEHILDLYAETPDANRPVVCFDETLKQLIEHVIEPIPAKPGETERVDHHYKRNGTAYIHVAVDFARKWRRVWVTEGRSRLEFADAMQELVDVHYPDADVIRVVLDNLNIHRPSSLYHAFPPEEARRILRKLEFHYTPVHASWLNMVEIEIGTMVRQCLDRRIATREAAAAELAAWETSSNEEQRTITWLFRVEQARERLGRFYPSVPLR